MNTNVLNRTRTCTKCGLTKPFAEYYRHHTDRFGLQPRCKVCYRAYYRQVWRKKHGVKRRMTLQELLAFIGKPDLKL